ncbi:hypothetical protein [Ralstonia insidiosa]|uniref:Uncharacterized protein n=1 Tax=Ralstonia insidiosa TaxID=190721 RepID=A0A848NVV9_9RALS|nr:hypothetical protein [Ralstonia insidiosa]NMV39391.1 hypothetical protein [Ralstonia insidiosa]
MTSPHFTRRAIRRPDLPDVALIRRVRAKPLFVAEPAASLRYTRRDFSPCPFNTRFKEHP